MKFKTFLIPLFLILTLIISGCALRRSDESEEIGPVSPDAPPVGQTTPDATQPTTEPPPAAPDDISTERFEAAVAPEPTPIEGKVLVKLNPQASIQARGAELGADGVVETEIPTLDDLLDEIGASELEPVVEEVVEATSDTGDSIETFAAQAEEITQLYAVNYDADRDPEEVADLLEQDPTVEYAEPDYMAGITAGPVDRPAGAEPNDPYFRFQWNFAVAQLPTAWDRTRGSGVVVAIVDTGIDFNTPDLQNTQRLPGYDFVNRDPDPTDDQGHGTHVAGTVAQSTNNNLGVAGVAYEATLLPVKVLGQNGQGSYEGIIQGIFYAVEQGADVINLSLAGRAGSQALQEAVEYAQNEGVVVIAAAGNSSGPVEFPAAYDDSVIAVGATGFDNSLAPYSNFGSQIDLVAPGGDTGVDLNGDTYGDGILQQTFKTAGGPYTYLFLEGTSMAAPHVSGVAALLLSVNPDLSPSEVKSVLMQTARNLGPLDQFGAGLLQAEAALNAIGAVPPQPTTEPTTEPTSEPTTEPTAEPTAEPTTQPTTEPTVQPTAEPTTEPTVQPTAEPPVAGQNLLTNGDFESETGWTFGDTPVRGSYDSAVVFGGGRSARLGIVSGQDAHSFSSVWQKVTIPAEANTVTLQANIYPISQDSGSDVQFIAILNDQFRVKRKLMANLSDSQAWEQVTFDISEFRGQTIYIYFSVFNRGRTGQPSAMYVDDVSLTWTN